MPELQTESHMYRDFSSYLNSIYETLQMDYVPFEKDNQYILPNAESKEVELVYHWYQQRCERLQKNTRSDNRQQC